MWLKGVILVLLFAFAIAEEKKKDAANPATRYGGRPARPSHAGVSHAGHFNQQGFAGGNVGLVGRPTSGFGHQAGFGQGGFVGKPGVIGHQGGFTGHQGGLLGQQGGFGAHQGGFVGQQGGFVGHQGGLVGHQGGLVGHQGGFGGHQGGLVGHQGGLVGHQGGFGGQHGTVVGQPGLVGVGGAIGVTNANLQYDCAATASTSQYGIDKTCKNYCRAPQEYFGRSYLCCESRTVGTCPPVRAQCPRYKGAGPVCCFVDSQCKRPTEKCCFDKCLNHKVCKESVPY